MACKRKASSSFPQADDSPAKRSRDAHLRSDTIELPETRLNKRKAADEPEESTSKRAITSQALIHPRLNFSATTLRRTRILFEISDGVPPSVQLTARETSDVSLVIAIPANAVNGVLSNLYEAEQQMRTSGVYEIVSVLGFLEGYRKDVIWPSNDIGVDNTGIVQAISQLKALQGYTWQDGPNAAQGMMWRPA